ncbi:hypothetical protein MBLNU13_g00764t1 [Cladosporium sp. NU13]
MDSHNAENMDVDPTKMYELVGEGQDLHSQLAAFASALHVSTSAQDISVAWMYYHALSIYLSGVFDYTLYEVCAIPSLRDDEIMVHVEGVLQRSDEALKQTRTSRVFLLLPLRIAGNRCRNWKQCQEVLNRIDILRDQFAVATAFRTELLQIWSTRSLHA